MAKAETLRQALKKEGSTDQVALCTKALLSLTRSQCKKLLEGHDVGISMKDKLSFSKLCKTRINKQQKILPFDNLKMAHEVDPNW